MRGEVSLSPIAEGELPNLLRLLYDAEAAGAFQWFGYRMDRAAELRRRWHDDRLVGLPQSYLAVHAGDELAGWVTWLPAPRQTATVEFGIALFPAHRGHGVGTRAQSLLVDALFSTAPVHRLEAGTEGDNLAEQRALENVGFRREGVLRGTTFRGGRWRDTVVYGLTRADLAGNT